MRAVGSNPTCVDGAQLGTNGKVSWESAFPNPSHF